MPRILTDSIFTDVEPPADWLIADTLHKGNLALLCGIAGIGKSIFSYALANSLATSTQLLDGNGAPPQRAIYFDEENGRADLSAYARWTWRGLGSPARSLLNENLRVESRTLSGANHWDRTLRELCGDFKPSLIILDTTTPACHIKNENDNAEAAAAAQRIRLAMDESGPDCAAILLKHLRVDSVTGRVDVRGAKHWKGAVDAIWYHLFCSGPRREDGWRNTYIRPDKSRAYGLRDKITIRPVIRPGLFCKLEISRAKYQSSEDD